MIFITLESTTEWCVCAFLHVESNHGGIAIATNSNLVLEIRLLGSSCPDKTAKQKYPAQGLSEIYTSIFLGSLSEIYTSIYNLLDAVVHPAIRGYR